MHKHIVLQVQRPKIGADHAASGIDGLRDRTAKEWLIIGAIHI